jgi:hypothetical protein
MSRTRETSLSREIDFAGTPACKISRQWRSKGREVPKMHFIMAALALLMTFSGDSAGQNASITPSAEQQEVRLTRADDGQKISTKVGQTIVITLQTIGGGNYGTPKISSRAVKFDSAAYPATKNPGGPTQIYRFSAADVGTAQIRIPHTGSNPAVTFTIRVKKQ